MIASTVLEKIRQCDTDEVLAALEENPQLKQPDYFEGRSLLEMAMQLNCLPLVRSLIIDKGVRLKKDILDLTGRHYKFLPLRVKPEIALFIFSCRLGHLDISKFLYDYFIVAQEPQKKEAILGEALAVVSAEDYTDYISWLISEGIDVNYEKDGTTALIVAATVGATKAAEVLIENGARVDYIQKHPRGGADALYTAVFNQHVNMVKLLLRHGANPYNSKTYRSRKFPNSIPYGNAIDAARFLNNEELMALLSPYESKR